MCELLIFGGTTEGRELARYCCETGVKAAVSVATRYGGELLPRHELLHILTGRLDSEAMMALMKELGCTVVIDATHPYAEEVTANILRACRETGIVCHRLLRSQSTLPECLKAEDMDGIIKLIDSCGGNVLSTLGSKELPKLTEVRDYRRRIWVRALPSDSVREMCRELGFPSQHLILEKGPFSVEQNIAHIKQSGAELLVTKESGAAGGFPEKTEAAELCGIGLAVLFRPREEGSTMEEIKTIIDSMRR